MDNRFDWQSYLTTAYGSFPEAKRKPVIGLTGNYGELACKLNEGYYKSIWRAGGVPVIIPPIADTDVLINTLEHIDGLLLTGGADFNPLYAGEEPSPRLGGINAERDLPELLIAQLAYNRQIPMLGICRGIQTLAMALGGKVRQDISDVAQIRHSQDADRSEPTHSVTIEPDSTLFNIYNKEKLFVNSFHHQAVCDPGERFRVTARSADGIIEAIESREYKSIIGVQWHPECMSAEDGSPIFSWLVQQAADYRRTCDLHQSILTLDTHCDTPMFFPQGIHFDHRDPKILVDLHKMT
jgi:gamma-glutamyl-gamma-aminobutyrate hydrolase PuuD